jgi:hypothetical protein
MFIHSVYFWLREDLTASERERFEHGVHSLAAIDEVASGYIGTPAPTDRPVIERGYSRSLVFLFADQRAHDAYQAHPVHDRFREDCAGYWRDIRIFDTVTA